MNEIVLTTNGRLARETVEALSKALSKKLGGEGVRHETDPSLIGGFTVKYNGTFYDASYATRLEGLKKYITEAEDEK